MMDFDPNATAEFPCKTATLYLDAKGQELCKLSYTLSTLATRQGLDPWLTGLAHLSLPLPRLIKPVNILRSSVSLERSCRWCTFLF